MYFLLEKVDFYCYVSLPEGILIENMAWTMVDAIATLFAIGDPQRPDEWRSAIHRGRC